ncbi:MAG: hypothetical protein H7A55_09685 [Verrucomicrobiaceae bacterium]|nr:hypothetical protein [Verrucomicrobiaceae bacterium]
MSHFFQLLQRLPFKLHWFLVLLMAFVIPALTARTDKPGEFYPFSNFPMYSSFEPATYFVYVTDEKDQDLRMGPLFGRAPSDVKKVYDRKLNDAKKAHGGKVKKADLPPEIRAEAAQTVLQWLIDNMPDKSPLAPAKGLRLHRVDIVFTDGAVKQTTQLEGEIALP